MRRDYNEGAVESNGSNGASNPKNAEHFLLLRHLVSNGLLALQCNEVRLTPAQIEAVKSSFAQVAPMAEEAAKLFYEQLFTLDPTLRSLFAEDMTAQRQKLMQMLSTAVNGLDQLETIVPAVKALGVRHIQYGIHDSHYETVGQALLWTLEQGLGPAFTSEIKAAWTEVYTLIAETMKGAAREAQITKPA